MKKLMIVMVSLVLGACASSNSVDQPRIPSGLTPIPILIGDNIKFPQKAIDDQVSGYVTFLFDLDDRGRPRNVEVFDAHPKDYFERAAKDAFRTWRFNTVDKDGELVTKNLIYTLEFNLVE